MTRKLLPAGMSGKVHFLESANTGVAIKSDDGILARVAVTTKDSGAVTLYNAANAANSSLMIANIDTTNSETSYEFGIEFDTGLFLVKTGNAAVSIVYQ